MTRLGSVSPERWKALEPLLDAALDLEPERRAAFLENACGGDAELRDELERLIDACERGSRILTSPAPAAYAPLLADPSPPLPESLGRYRLIRELGRGGMATVYLADDPKHGRRVALKVLHSEVARLVGRERFLREIEIAARLSHPHILPLHDSVEPEGERGTGDGPGVLYYVTPYVAGETLRDRLRREGRLPADEAVRLGREIAGALDYAHRQGLVHCDVKPENVLLQEGHAVVADFGIARAISSSVAGDAAALAGLPFGTPAYMSPEQAAGRVDLDGRSDVYSLGCMLHEMLTGERPAPMARRPPAALAAVIARAMAPAPADRFATAGEMALALGAAGLGKRPLRRVVALAVLAASVAGALFLARRSTARPDLDPNLVAVAPFEVVDPALALWREGLVDVLARNLDGAGPLRAVPPTVVVRRWRGRADAATARELGERTGARLVLYGGLLSAGDSVRATLAILDTRTGRPFAEFERRDLAGRMDRVADSLTVAVLRELGRSRRIEAARASFSPTASLPALKEFLQGEQFYRRAEWDSAQGHFEQALALDSTFAIVYHRLAGVREWRDPTEFGDSAISELLQRASRFRRGLGPRDSLLVSIDSLRGAVDFALRRRVRTREPAEHEAAVRRLLGTLAEGTRRHPQDPELWFRYAEGRIAHEQWVSLGEIDERAILATYDRAIALDSTFAPAYVMPIWLSAHLDGAAGTRRYIAGYLAARPSGEHAQLIVLADGLLDPARAANLDLDRLADTLPAERACEVAALLSRVPDSAETAVRLFRRALGRQGQAADEPAGGCSRIAAAYAFMFRGHLREAARLAVAPEHWLRTTLARDLARFGMVPPDSTRRVFQRLLTRAPRTQAATAYGWWATDRDTAAIRTYIGHYEAKASATTGAFATMLRGSALSGHAYFALARGDTAGAMQRLLAVPDSLQLCWSYGRLTLAQLLVATGRIGEAGNLLERRWAGTSRCGTPIEDLLWTLVRGRAFERLGRREEARAGYGLVTDAWRTADPELQPFVREARSGASRLEAARR